MSERRKTSKPCKGYLDFTLVDLFADHYIVGMVEK